MTAMKSPKTVALLSLKVVVSVALFWWLFHRLQWSTIAPVLESVGPM